MSVNVTTKIRLYCCGGAATNIGLKLNPQIASPCFVDTSEANTTEGLDYEICHFIEDLDGSGKNRRENYDKIAADIPTVIEKFPAGDFNIVLSSAAGGSGSVIANLLTKALLEDKRAVVVVLIGADDSANHADNTVNTIKSFESISVLTGMPVVMAYSQNTLGVSRAAVDDEILFVLESLEALASQDNRELDTKDVTNWLQYHKVSPVQPQLSALTVFDTRQDAASQVEPVAIVSLYADPSKDLPFGNPHYRAVGYPRSGTLPNGEQLHFVINLAGIEEIYKHLAERQAELNRTYSGYRQRKALVDVDDTLTGDGLVL